MSCLWRKCCGTKSDYYDEESSSDDGGIEDACVAKLSYVGTAAYEVLQKKQARHRHKLWNITTAKVGELMFTPKDAFSRCSVDSTNDTDTNTNANPLTDPPEGHDDWFPEQLGDILSRTEQWLDVMSLAPPDGLFMASFKKALADLCGERSQAASFGKQGIVIRMMFGNIVGMPVDCNRVIHELTKDLPGDAPDKLALWVGSWRKGVSWNHAKLIAVDGRYLWTGGHNFWDYHYLKSNPCQDLSIVLEGEVARDAHRFANEQWKYIVRKQSTPWGRFVDRCVPDFCFVPLRSRVTVSEWPPRPRATEFPPCYRHRATINRDRRGSGRVEEEEARDHVTPVLTVGRYATLLRIARPSDDAFVAMLWAARVSVRLAVQDLGPVLLPGTRLALPGLTWPYEYLHALARVMWLKGVQVEIVLSNPNSIPGNLSMTEANYGNGWNCVDVAAEIIKTMQKKFPNAHDGDLRQCVQNNLRVCFLRSPTGCSYKNGGTLGLHSKHFIIDDICCYIGSQNLYHSDLAEWGVVIDDAQQVRSIKAQYWDPLWKVSYTRDDCDVQLVMDGLNIDRSAPSKIKVNIQMKWQKTMESLESLRSNLGRVTIPEEEPNAGDEVLDEGANSPLLKQ